MARGGMDMESKLLNTVNVIEMNGDYVIGMASYKDDAEGNALAEGRFKALCAENAGEVALDMESCLEIGVCEVGPWKILLVHSTET